MSETSSPTDGPYGKAIGLLAASVVTLVGILRGVQPDVILLRAAVAALVCGVVARVVISTLQRFAKA